jgi:inosose dehydratase
MNRRQFLQASIALGSLRVLGAGKERRHPSLTLGFSLYGMKTLKTEESLRQLSKIGYDSVELCLNEGWDAAPKKVTAKRRKELRILLGDLGLKLTALMINIKLNGQQKISIAKIREAAQIGHDLCPDNPPVIESVGGGGKWAEVKNEFRDNLSHWAEAGKTSKTIVCLKPHRFGAVNRPEDAVWLADQINSPWLKLAYDYSHFIHRDINFEESLKTMIPHTRFIHVKDTIIKDGKPRFVIPGESGQIDYAKLVSLSAKLGYRGDINAEISGQVWGQKGYDPIATATDSYKNLASAFKLEK